MKSELKKFRQKKKNDEMKKHDILYSMSSLEKIDEVNESGESEMVPGLP